MRPRKCLQATCPHPSDLRALLTRDFMAQLVICRLKICPGSSWTHSTARDPCRLEILATSGIPLSTKDQIKKTSSWGTLPSFAFYQRARCWFMAWSTTVSWIPTASNKPYWMSELVGCWQFLTKTSKSCIHFHCQIMKGNSCFLGNGSMVKSATTTYIVLRARHHTSLPLWQASRVLLLPSSLLRTNSYYKPMEWSKAWFRNKQWIKRIFLKTK